MAFCRDRNEKVWPASERQYGLFSPDSMLVYQLAYSPSPPHIPGGEGGGFNGTDGDSGYYDI
jgi:hypothetical protein